MKTDNLIFTITNERAAELEEHVFRYKNGDLSASEQILEILNYTILRFMKILTSNSVNFKDELSRKLVYALVKADNKRPSFSTDKDRAQASLAFCSFTDSLFKKYDRSDIYNEIVVIILNMAHAYDYQDTNFYHHINKSLVYRVIDKIKELTSDMITSNTSKRLCAENIIEFISEEDARLAAIRSGDEESEYNTLGESWIRGEQCHPIFEILTPSERKILVMKYGSEEYVTDQEIADHLGLSRRWLWQKRQGIIEKLQEYAKSNPCSFF